MALACDCGRFAPTCPVDGSKPVILPVRSMPPYQPFLSQRAPSTYPQFWLPGVSSGHAAAVSGVLGVSVHTDTPKTPLTAAAWPDDTPGNQNWGYVLGARWLKNGWYGGIDRTGKITGFDPSTGQVGANLPQSQANAMPVAGAIAYAVAK